MKFLQFKKISEIIKIETHKIVSLREAFNFRGFLMALKSKTKYPTKN
jgi:hypothetical protein